MKGRKYRETGGANEAEEDENTKPEARTDAKNIDAEAEERASGGRTKKKSKELDGFEEGGELHPIRASAGYSNRKAGGAQHKKKRRHGGKTEIGKIEGEHGAHHAGRKPRARGGSTSDANPFTSARKGEDAPGRKVMKGELGFGED